MSEIKHISLDAWNTVLIPNSDYAKARTTILANLFNCSFAFAKTTYSKIKKEIDGLAENNGQAFDVDYIYSRLVDAFPHGNLQDPEQVRRMYFEYAFKENPPTILDSTANEIKRLAEKGVTFSISSNTNFISGEILGPIIRKKIPHFDFMLFSDLMLPHVLPGGHYVKAAKPHDVFFSEVHRFANQLHGRALDKSEILHIGDSKICDEEGAAKYGFKSQLIENVEQLPIILGDF